MQTQTPTMSDPSPHRGRAIVTYARGVHALTTIRSLGRKGIEVIAADAYAPTPGAMSRYATDSFRYPDPLEDHEAFIDALAAAVEEYAPASDVPYALIPVHREGYWVAHARQRFAGRIGLALAEAPAIALARHKRQLTRFAREHDIAVPRSWMPSSQPELDAMITEIEFPAFVKVPSSVGGLGVRKVANEAELRSSVRELVAELALEGDEWPMVQAAAPGHDYCVAALFDRGRPVVLTSYENLATFPRDGGPGAIRQSLAAPQLEDVARRLLEALDWHGVAQVDLRWTGNEEDEPLLIEINPRFFTGLLQTIEAGVDLPWLTFQLATGQPLDANIEMRFDKRTEVPLLGMLASIREAAASDSTVERLGRAWQDWRSAIGAGSPLAGTKALIATLRDTIDIGERLDAVKQALEANRDNVMVLWDEDDPLPVLGMLYPLTMFLRHGKVDKRVLSGL